MVELLCYCYGLDVFDGVVCHRVNTMDTVSTVFNGCDMSTSLSLYDGCGMDVTTEMDVDFLLTCAASAV